MARGDVSLLRQAPRLTVALLCLPIAAGLAGTIWPALADHAAGLRMAIAWPGFQGALWLSIKTGFLATSISLAVTLGLIAGLHGTRSFAAIQHLLAPLLSVPHAAAALGLAFLIAPSGWISRIISPSLTGWTQPPDLLILNDPGGWALILGLVAKEIPFLFLLSLAALPQTDAARRMAVAYSLGAGRMAAFAVAVLPALYRQIRLPVYAVLAYSATAVEIAMILGPSLPPTLSVQIVTWMNDASLTQRETAAGGALIQLVTVVFLIAIWRVLERLARTGIRRWADAGARGHVLQRTFQPFAIMSGLVSAGLLVAGLAGLALWSFAGLWPYPEALPQSFSLAIWNRTGDDLMTATWDTTRIAATATLFALCLTLGCLEAERRFALRQGPTAAWLLYLPLLVPQIAFLPGLQGLALISGAEGHWTAVAAAHLIFVLPYLFLSLAPAYRAWDTRYETAAMALGAPPARIFWKIRLPMLLRPILTAVAVGMAVSIGQYLPTLLIGGGRVATLTTEAVALSSGGNRRLIGAYAFLQMALPTLFFSIALLVPAFVFRNRRGLAVAG